MSPNVQAAPLLTLPEPGHMVSLSATYQPAILRGVTVNKDNPFLFDFIVDPGQDQKDTTALKTEGERLVKYFLAALTVPAKDLWVNLSPYEKNKIVGDDLGQTDMGRDLLAQDYILKQITASLIYPEKELGKKFWDKVYEKAQVKYGSVNMPVNTFNKVWIMADQAEVYEHEQTAYVTKSHLKVLLETDYLAQQKQEVSKSILRSQERKHLDGAGLPQKDNDTNQIIKEIILPELEREVNEGKNFATLRQIFNSIILAGWYKHNLKDALLNQVYSDKSVVAGIDIEDKDIKQKIYERYLQAYKKGVFNYVKEDVSLRALPAARLPDGQGRQGAVGDEAILNKQSAPRKYFSGGVDANSAMTPVVTRDRSIADAAMTERGSRLFRLIAGFNGSSVQDFMVQLTNSIQQLVETATKNPRQLNSFNYIRFDSWIRENLQGATVQDRQVVINVLREQLIGMLALVSVNLQQHGLSKEDLIVVDPVNDPVSIIVAFNQRVEMTISMIDSNFQAGRRAANSSGGFGRNSGQDSRRSGGSSGGFVITPADEIFMEGYDADASLRDGLQIVEISHVAQEIATDVAHLETFAGSGSPAMVVTPAQRDVLYDVFSVMRSGTKQILEGTRLYEKLKGMGENPGLIGDLIYDFLFPRESIVFAYLEGTQHFVAGQTISLSVLLQECVYRKLKDLYGLQAEDVYKVELDQESLQKVEEMQEIFNGANLKKDMQYAFGENEQALVVGFVRMLLDAESSQSDLEQLSQNILGNLTPQQVELLDQEAGGFDRKLLSQIMLEAVRHIIRLKKFPNNIQYQLQTTAFLKDVFIQFFRSHQYRGNLIPILGVIMGQMIFAKTTTPDRAMFSDVAAALLLGGGAIVGYLWHRRSKAPKPITKEMLEAIRETGKRKGELLILPKYVEALLQIDEDSASPEFLVYVDEKSKSLLHRIKGWAISTEKIDRFGIFITMQNGGDRLKLSDYLVRLGVLVREGKHGEVVRMAEKTYFSKADLRVLIVGNKEGEARLAAEMYLEQVWLRLGKMVGYLHKVLSSIENRKREISRLESKSKRTSQDDQKLKEISLELKKDIQLERSLRGYARDLIDLRARINFHKKRGGESFISTKPSSGVKKTATTEPDESTGEAVADLRPVIGYHSSSLWDSRGLASTLGDDGEGEQGDAGAVNGIIAEFVAAIHEGKNRVQSNVRQVVLSDVYPRFFNASIRRDEGYSSKFTVEDEEALNQAIADFQVKYPNITKENVEQIRSSFVWTENIFPGLMALIFLHDFEERDYQTALGYQQEILRQKNAESGLQDRHAMHKVMALFLAIKQFREGAVNEVSLLADRRLDRASAAMLSSDARERLQTMVNRLKAWGEGLKLFYFTKPEAEVSQSSYIQGPRSLTEGDLTSLNRNSLFRNNFTKNIRELHNKRFNVDGSINFNFNMNLNMETKSFQETLTSKLGLALENKEDQTAVKKLMLMLDVLISVANTISNGGREKALLELVRQNQNDPILRQYRLIAALYFILNDRNWDEVNALDGVMSIDLRDRTIDTFVGISQKSQEERSRTSIERATAMIFEEYGSKHIRLIQLARDNFSQEQFAHLTQKVTEWYQEVVDKVRNVTPQNDNEAVLFGLVMTAIAERAGVDRATLTQDKTGGIDLINTQDNTNVLKDKDGGVKIKLDPAMIERVKREGIQSLTPVIYKITPVINIRALLGLDTPAHTDDRLAGA